MGKQYPRIESTLYNTPHVIELSKAKAISSIFERRAVGESLGASEVAMIVGEAPDPVNAAMWITPDGCEHHAYALVQGAAVAQPKPPAHRSGQLISVVPLFGTLTQHGSSLNSSGVTSLSRFMAEVRKAVNDPDVGTVVIQVNSPGGEVFGTEEAATELHGLRGNKRIIASVDSMMASGALWVATAASEVTITPGGTAGSHGVVTIHQDISQAEEQMGIKTTLVATPAKKVAGNPFEPLDESTIADIERKNGLVFDKFTAALARNRDMKAKAVVEQFGGGGMLMADEAKAAGMVDRIEPFRATIERILAGVKSDNRQASARRARSLQV